MNRTALFQRIPFTSDYDLFKQMANHGEELTALHLLNHKSLNRPLIKYFGKADSNVIEKPFYNEQQQRVYINEHKYFENVSAENWNYFIGGYQPMEKYLKDRKGREMNDPVHYCKMGPAIAQTIEIQNEIDELFLQIGPNLIVH